MPPTIALRYAVAVLVLGVLAGILTLLRISRLRREAASARRAQADSEGRLALTEKLYQLSSAFSSARTPAEVTASCLQELAHAFDAGAGAAFLLSPDATVFELSQKIGYPELRAASAVQFSTLQESPLTEAIRRRQLAVVPAGARRDVNRGTPPERFRT